MNKFANIFRFFPYVLGGVVAVEQVIGAGASGAAKKDLILNSIKAISVVGEQVPEAHVQQISAMIDSIVTTLNQSGVFSHGGVVAPVAAAA